MSRRGDFARVLRIVLCGHDPKRSLFPRRPTAFEGQGAVFGMAIHCGKSEAEVSSPNEHLRFRMASTAVSRLSMPRKSKGKKTLALFPA
jgi:hypothetical protein